MKAVPRRIRFVGMLTVASRDRARLIRWCAALFHSLGFNESAMVCDRSFSVSRMAPSDGPGGITAGDVASTLLAGGSFSDQIATSLRGTGVAIYVNETG